MTFDLATAKPINDITGFDLSTAQSVQPVAANDTHIANDLLNALPDYARGMNEIATTALKGVSLATATPLIGIDPWLRSRLR